MPGFRLDVMGRLYISAYTSNPISGKQEEAETLISDDGSFELRLPMVTTSQVNLNVQFLFRESVLLSPGEVSTFYFDLQQRAINESHNRIDKGKEDGRLIYFGGANALINDEWTAAEMSTNLYKIFDQEKIQNDIPGMSPDEYKTYIFRLRGEMLDFIADQHFSKATETLALRFADMETSRYIAMADYFNEMAFRQARGLDYRDELTGYQRPLFDREFYSSLKELRLNDPHNLYLSGYSFDVGNAASVRISEDSVELSRFTSVTYPDWAYKNLIEKYDMGPEEKAVAEYIIASAKHNWPPEAITAFKEEISQAFTPIVATDTLQGRKREIAEQILKLCKEEENNVSTIDNYQFEFFYNQNEQTVTGMAGININDYLHDIDTVSQEQMGTFQLKYKKDLEAADRMMDIHEKQANLRELLGEEKGVVFNVVAGVSAAQTLEEYTALSEEELQMFADMDDPFYYDYFNRQNDAMIALLREREGQRPENIFDVPEVENDTLLYEILKPHQGKVIFVDFWNTWCGPCLMAMRDFKEDKESFKDKDVVFVYLADDSSPSVKWETMIPDIGGVHYRLTQAQIRYIMKKYDLTGFPSYLIFGKNGAKAYAKTAFYQQEIIKTLNEELAK